MAAPFRAIGVVGMGFVGRAVAEYLSRFFEVFSYDSANVGHRRCHLGGNELYDIDDDTACTANWATWITQQVDGPIFICVPTPAAPDGRCDTSIVEEVLYQLEEHSAPDYRNVAVIKSTVPPGTTDRLNSRELVAGHPPRFTCVHNPEFLTQRTAAFDFAHQKNIILGGPMAAVDVVTAMYEFAFPFPMVDSGPILWCIPAIEAELIKYMRNCFYAVKVAYANEVYALCDRLGVQYERMMATAICDDNEWMGQQHWQVPGPDGQVGFGGKCLPKDLAALIHLCQEQGVNCDTMLGAAMSNKIRRPDDDQPAVRGPYRSPC